MYDIFGVTKAMLSVEYFLGMQSHAHCKIFLE